MAATVLACVFPLQCTADLGCMEDKPLSLILRYESGVPLADLIISENPAIPAAIVETEDGDIHIFASSTLTGTYLISTSAFGGRANLSAHVGVAGEREIVWADGLCEEENP